MPNPTAAMNLHTPRRAPTRPFVPLLIALLVGLAACATPVASSAYVIVIAVTMSAAVPANVPICVAW